MSYWSELAERAVAVGGEVEPTPIVWPPHVHEFTGSQMREVKRITLYIWQWGKCFWCMNDMSLDRWRPRVTGEGMKQNDQFASFEHLKRRRDGGTLKWDNVRLAHAGCNRKRDQKNGLPRYAHDPHPVGKHVRNSHPQREANTPDVSARARRRAAAAAKALLPARPVAPLVQGKHPVAAPVSRLPPVRPARPPVH